MSKIPPFRTYYDGLQASISEATGLDCSVPVLADADHPSRSLTSQSMAAECDINNIMAKYDSSGVVRVRDEHARGEYSDLSDMPTFHEALNIVSSAREAFADLPASLREKFSNDPAKFLDVISRDDPDELARYGLSHPSPGSPDPVSVRVVPDPASSPAEPLAEPKA